jgi:uncharacterized protein HemY
LLVTCSNLELRDPQRAVELARRATELSPQAGMYWNTLGIAQFRQREWKAAIDALTKSATLHSGQNLAYDGFFLAMACHQVGETEKALDWYRRSCEWMDKYNFGGEELKRFRQEAEDLLQVASKTQPGTDIRSHGPDQ